MSKSLVETIEYQLVLHLSWVSRGMNKSLIQNPWVSSCVFDLKGKKMKKVHQAAANQDGFTEIQYIIGNSDSDIVLQQKWFGKLTKQDSLAKHYRKKIKSQV